MEKCWVICMVIGLFVGIVKAQAEAVFPDYVFYDAIPSDAKNIESNEQNEGIIEQSDIANNDIQNYNIDQIINSALAEGLNDDFEANDSSSNNEEQNVDENQENQDDNVNYEVPNDAEVVENLDNQSVDEQNAENKDTNNPENIPGDNVPVRYWRDDGFSENEDSNFQAPQVDERVNSDEERINAEIDNFKQMLAGGEEVENAELNEEDANGNLDDYQFEDNRSEAKEARNDVPSDSDASFENVENQDSDEENVGQGARVDFPDPVAENEEIFDETKQILNEPDNINELVVDEEQNADVAENIKEIVEKANQLLQEDVDEESEILAQNVEINKQFDPIENMNNENVSGEPENMDNEPVFDDSENIINEPVFEEQVPDEQVPIEDENEDVSNHDYGQVDYQESPEEAFVDYFDGHEAEADKIEDQNLVNEEEAVENPVDNIEQQFEAQSDEENNDYESEDTVGKVQADLNKDLQHLFDTWNKLSQNSDDIPEENADSSAVEENVEEYEQKYGKPYGEDTILAQRDYANDEIDQVVDKNDADDNVPEENVDVSDETNIEQNIPETGIDDIVFFGVQKLINAGEDVSNQEDEQIENAEVNVSADIKVENPEDNQFVEIEESAINNEENTADQIVQENILEESEVELIAENSENIAPENESANIVLEENSSQSQEVLENIEVKPEQKTMDVSELTSTQYDALMEQFAIVHSADMNPQSEDFAKHVAPIHIALSVNEATVVTSPNYPENYPTNNIIDWIFDGEGVGIEFNITDLELNGAMGDYLLVKPGSLDESGSEGLIFSFHLTEPRQYRFLDVDRMFVRFQSNAALTGFNKGFSFSVKMVAEISEESSPSPTPEPLLPPPATLTVYLGGMTLGDFREIREDFRRVVADMATLYVNTHGMDPGLNTTLEVTQITSIGVCNIKWPSFENCVEVTFGVPLNYPDDDVQRLTEAELTDMWGSLFYVDPFAHRLTRMGIAEFSSPNEGAILTAWLVIGGGVLISAAMLAFALWRFSCFEDYTRMAPFSDTDSIRSEKRGLDLYPTPHQTLPPLYSQEYKWVDDDVKVDMGGFTNKSYARDELFDIDSDNEVSVPRDRYTSDV